MYSQNQNHNYSNIDPADNNFSDDDDRDATEKEAIMMIEAQQLEIQKLKNQLQNATSINQEDFQG
jgi:hypothetical protein